MEKIWIKNYSVGVPAQIDVVAIGSIADFFDEAVIRHGEGARRSCFTCTSSIGSRT